MLSLDNCRWIGIDCLGPALRDLPPLRVLVVEGNRDAADTEATLLQLWGYDVHVARNGTEALHSAAAYHPDVALIELVLPEIDGYQLAGQFRQQRDLRGVVLIARTGLATDTVRQRCRKSGFADHVTKPVDPVDLHHLLEVLALQKSHMPPTYCGPCALPSI